MRSSRGAKEESRAQLQASGVYLIQDVLNPPALYGVDLQYRF